MFQQEDYKRPCLRVHQHTKGVVVRCCTTSTFATSNPYQATGVVLCRISGSATYRFQHSLGAFHLMSEAIKHLTAKGNFIFDSEAEAVQAAILLHDIGHGPFSHVLENTLAEAFHMKKSP